MKFFTGSKVPSFAETSLSSTVKGTCSSLNCSPAIKLVKGCHQRNAKRKDARISPYLRCPRKPRHPAPSGQAWRYGSSSIRYCGEKGLGEKAKLQHEIVQLVQQNLENIFLGARSHQLALVAGKQNWNLIFIDQSVGENLVQIAKGG